MYQENKNKKCYIHIGMHKTGSTSIQTTLNKNTSDNFHYVQMDTPNHGGNIFTLFSDHPEKYHAWRKLGKSKDEINKIAKETEKQLIQNFTENNLNNFIISGEDIITLSHNELMKFKSFLENYFDTIIIIGYVRSPKSYIESAFQQSIKGYLNNFNIDGMYPIYRNKFEKFDTVFDKENVKLFYFNPDTLVDKNVVLDFCSKVGMTINDSTLERLTNLYQEKQYHYFIPIENMVLAMALGME